MSVQDVTYLQPLTLEQREAVIHCRFSTTNVPRELGWLCTDDEKIVETLRDVVASVEPYVADWKTMRQSWDMRFTHPEIIELVVLIMERRVAS